MKKFMLFALTGLVSVASSAHGQQYRVWTDVPEGATISSGWMDTPVIIHGSFSGIDPWGDPQSYTADSMGSGGQVPLADIQASSLNAPHGLSGTNVESRIIYTYRVNRIAGSTRTAVPLIIHAAADAQATSNSDSPGASALATVRVSFTGNTNNNIIHDSAFAWASTGSNNPSDQFNVTISTVVQVGANGIVELRAFGGFTSDGEISATADPTFLIDPDATYIENGETFRYIDEFVLEYSPTIDQYIPCAPDLTGDGQLDFFDISKFLTDLIDYNNDTSFDFFDISAFLTDFTGGCP